MLRILKKKKNLKVTNKPKHPSSFRDPSGYIFLDQGVLKRTVNPIYFKQYYSLKDSGFFNKLFKHELLVKHEEDLVSDNEIILKPEHIPFITYPYEWSFLQYKEAALLTLKLQKYCLENNYSLKDASAFNITFHKGKALFIDTLSFDFYSENTPWRAYKQFIMHFLGPLVLARYHGSHSIKLMCNFMDGIPLKMLASMLPLKTKLNPFLYTNIHLLARFEEKHNEVLDADRKIKSLSKNGQLNIITSLYNYIKKLTLKEDSEWTNYYDKINYTEDAFIQKANIINDWLETLQVKTLIDIGGNDGTFVRKIKHKPQHSLVCDIDNNAVDTNYSMIKETGESSITPFILDVLNPSPAIGFQNIERMSFIGRIKIFAPDVTLALAIIHHMSLSGNVGFDMSASFFASFSKHLIIEFPKRQDSWVERLLSNKSDFKDYFDFYNINNFERKYLNYFEIIEKQSIENTMRVMYFLKLKHVK